jgi:hypothetical protein
MREIATNDARGAEGRAIEGHPGAGAPQQRGRIVTNRLRDSELLFQRLEASRAEPGDPALDKEAARATEAWPLLGLLGPRVSVAARSAPGRAEIAQLAAAIPDELAPEPAMAPSPPAAAEPAKPVSPLDQLFARLDRAAAAKNAPPSLRNQDDEPPAPRVAALRPAAGPGEAARGWRREWESEEEAALQLFEKMARR